MSLRSTLSPTSSFPVAQRDWTAILPAAGRGSRLGFAGPKALYPLLGRPLISWVINAVSHHCVRTIVVTAPTGLREIQFTLETFHPEITFDYCVQPTPNGTADAVRRTQELVTTPRCLIAWADQASIRPDTVTRCLEAHSQTASLQLTFPTAKRLKPYIHLDRNPDGRIQHVLQAREAAIPADVGESDCGFFLFETRSLFTQLTRTQDHNLAGAGTGEVNLLSLIPHFDESPGRCLTLDGATPEETLGVNTPEEAVQVEGILKRRPWAKTTK
ncbi:MAG: NTP transferase domain-containing protein [Deltaproteobacteria bacterium]|nr:NTP transferase domain-containing protein [Deltaproteobacteria bacterium]MBI3295313.1 NTP transferase domain-containing protein [Deltaproteobacteria bacterium]